MTIDNFIKRNNIIAQTYTMLERTKEDEDIFQLCPQL